MRTAIVILLFVLAAANIALAVLPATPDVSYSNLLIGTWLTFLFGTTLGGSQ